MMGTRKRNRRKVYYLATCTRLPIFRLGTMLCARKSVLMRLITEQEDECFRLLNAAEAAPPPPFGPVPTERQLRWHEMEFYGFVHFTVNTFKDQEWGYGDEPESLFNPTDFSAEQIAATARAADVCLNAGESQ